MPSSFKPSARTRAALAAAVSAGAGLALGAAAVAVILTLPQPAPVSGAVVRVALPPVAVVVAAPTVTATRAVAAPIVAARRDLECLTEAVYFEARGETGAGQAAVAQVVLNRVKHPAFPKTVCGVVYQGAKSRGCQFSFACDGRTEHASEGLAWRRARQVAARALAGVVAPQVGSATHFHAAAVQPSWGPGLRRVAQVGLHVFYRLGSPGAPAVHAAPAKAVFTRLASAESEDGSKSLAFVDPSDALSQDAAPATAPEPAAAAEVSAAGH